MLGTSISSWLILGFILVSLIVIYFSARIKVWSFSMLAFLIATFFLFSDSSSSGLFLSLCALYIVITLLFGVVPIRLKLTKVIYERAKLILPKISDTERLALNAGDPWFEKEIFQGRPNYETLHAIKKFSLSSDEESFLNTQTIELCKMLDDWQINHIDRDLPANVWKFLCDNKFFGLVIPKEYGGLGFSAAAHSQIVMKIATRSTSAAVTVMVPNSLGPGELLVHYGTDKQKEYYLPRLANGREIPCFALTGPTAGSDATSIPDEGIVCYGEYEGQTVLGIKLINVDKRYITLAPVATLVGLAFQLRDPENLLNGVGKPGITCALLPHNHIGLEIGNRLFPLSQAFMNGTVRIKETFIPIDWIIGGQVMAGEGWRMLVECLSIGRAISLPACGTANALLSTVTTSAYSIIREQFKLPIGQFEGVEEKLCEMSGIAYLMNATREFTVSAIDNGVRPSVASAIAKYHLTENGRKVLNDAMDIHAGRGIIMGPNNYLAHAYEGIPIGITVEGANILTRNLMIFGQGAMRCHPYIRREYEAFMLDDGVKEFDNAMFSHIGYFLSNLTRSIFHAFTGGIFAKGYSKSKFNNYYKQISRLSSAFAYINDLALITLGGEIKRKERLSARLGDAMSYLYMACSSLKYFKDNNERGSDEVFLEWGLQHSLHNAQNSLIHVLDNFPIKSLGKVVKFLMFPFGRPFKKPSDFLEHKVSKTLLSDCATREAFKALCFIPEDYADVIGRVEVTYKNILANLPIRQKIQAAIKARQLKKGPYPQIVKEAKELGIISEEEFNKLNLTSNQVNEVIQVDEFSPLELGPKNLHKLTLASSEQGTALI